ncbi:bifunctional RNase H/acid phosphatase [Nocardioides perillae]|uniref:Putative phosphoglycerate mutase n=1 Tax=Nocardioides perillae TaxID=1119534 RepID=A0A7Y9UMN7_9ACTN|nr:putative phosphoglycerate mutase [Nocardioides perillae]
MTGSATPSRVVVEADGGSRGNPGPAAYGALLRDADTGALIAEDGATLGVATNNVAEYSGLLAGLRLARDHAPGAVVEVRMDSKLVVEQMSGRWKIKHPDMRPLALEARELAPPGTTYTWVPRAQNAHADRLANEALDGVAEGVRLPGGTAVGGVGRAPDPTRGGDEAQPASAQAQQRGWSPAGGPPTTLVLVRHGVTAHTQAKRFSGGLGGADPALSDEGRAQVRAVGEWLAPLADRVDAVLTSPVRRTVESAEVLAALLGDHEVVPEPGFAEMEFGRWDGLTFAEVRERDPEALDAWLAATDVPPPGGESFAEVRERVAAALERVLRGHAGRTVVVASHVTPIKVLVAQALGAPLEALYRMELAPASVTVIAYHPDPDAPAEPVPGHRPSLRLFNGRATAL